MPQAAGSNALAANIGNGAISYLAPPLFRIPGLKFDAAGTDPGGCPGTTLRTVCGMPTMTGANIFFWTAADADSAMNSLDEDRLFVDLYIYGASISSTSSRR